MLSQLPEVAHDLARVLERIYGRSQAFRAQCERIAGAGRLRVTRRIDRDSRPVPRAD